MTDLPVMSDMTGPGRVAILGAGPVGLDAALACLDAGWPCTVYEAAPAVAGHVRTWEHVRLFTPWSMNLSYRMREHLAAAGVPVPDGPGFPTGAELVSGLLEPLAALPELAAVLRTDMRVSGIARAGILKHEHIGSAARGARPFRLLLEGAAGREWTEQAEVVLDCTGSYPAANALGDGGIPAPGERAAGHRVMRRIPDVAADLGSWAGRRTLLVGAGKSAQTAARDLAELAARVPGTELVWAVRDAAPRWGAVEHDPLPQRQELVDVAERLHAGLVPAVSVRTGVAVDAMEPEGDRMRVTLRCPDGSTEPVTVDQVLALTGSLGDTGLYRQLQVHECYATAAPMNLSAALLAAAGDGPADCLAQATQGVDVLRVPEPNFFVLGIKSYGRNSAFLLRVGYEQVDAVTGSYLATAMAS